MITFFNDYKVYHNLQYEAKRRNKTMSEALTDAIICYVKKSEESVDEKEIKNKFKFWKIIKKNAENKGCTVAEIIEMACIDYCGLTVQVVQKTDQKKSGSFFDLNRDKK